MNETINAFFGWSDRDLPQQKLTVVTDTLQADGQFALLHFVSLFAKARQTVCFVGFDQTFIHYFSVLRKFVRTAENKLGCRNFWLLCLVFGVSEMINQLSSTCFESKITIPYVSLSIELSLRYNFVMLTFMAAFFIGNQLENTFI